MRRELAHLTSEGEFFHRLDVELLDKMRKCADTDLQRQHMTEASKRRCAELEQERSQMAEASRIDDPEVLWTLQKLGYNSATALLVYFVPQVLTAWSDGSVSRAERKLVLRIANLHGVQRDTPEYNHLAAWLERRPRERLLKGSLGALRCLLQSLPPNECKARRASLMKECRAVAGASGGLLNKVCAVEQKILEMIERELEQQPHDASRAADAGR